ncbi:PGF-CTERM sorting domain-containing protein [Halobacteriales archaeon QH_7_69_31]|nr:MAG: PGF-CTERM sorting domain-containing protein [Halobacteriales archaeon QH_7_69_31]
MNLRATVLTALLVTSVIGAAAAPAATQQAEGEAYSGTFVQFETGNAAVTNYAVDGSVVVDSVRAQSASETEGGIGVDAGASSSTAISGSAVSTSSQGSASASVAFESGTDMEAHDNQRGVVTFTASDGDQVVQANVSGDASSEGDSRVVVQGDDGAQGTFIVVGDGNVTTNADGQVTARVEEDSQLVYRQYNDERSDSEKTQEEMIQNGKATAEVYVYGAAESGEDGEESAESVVTYGQDTNAEVQERSQNRINVTVERTESQGKVLITTVSESAVENAESLEVYVDGEAAAQAESYSDVRAATEGADQSRYMVRQSGSAEAAVDVIVGINQFSERTVSMQSAGDGGEPTATDGDDTMDGDDTDGGDGTDGDGAGFGVLAALVALAAALIAVRKRS